MDVNAAVVIILEVVLDANLMHGTKLTNNATAFGTNAYELALKTTKTLAI